MVIAFAMRMSLSLTIPEMVSKHHQTKESKDDSCPDSVVLNQTFINITYNSQKHNWDENVQVSAKFIFVLYL